MSYMKINVKASIIEKSEFKTPSLASLKEKFPNTPIKELKAKILAALASKLDMDEDIMSTSSLKETPTMSEVEEDLGDTECLNSNEDMTAHMGHYLSELYREIRQEKEKEMEPTVRIRSPTADS